MEGFEELEEVDLGLEKEAGFLQRGGPFYAREHRRSWTPTKHGDLSA